MIGLWFTVAGIGAGAIQAGLLAHRVGGGHPAWLLVRLLLPVVFLVVSAREGHLGMGVVGWFGGFGGMGTLIYRRMG